VNSSLPVSDDSMRRFRRIDAAAYVRNKWGVPCAPKWLAKLATTGGGPKFARFGRVPIYTDVDLDDWVLSRMSPIVGSTSELGGGTRT
jgi:hypothetical protein